MRPTAEQSRSNADSGGRFETMTNTRDTRMVMIVDSQTAQQRFLSALASRGGWRRVIAPDPATPLATLGTQAGQPLNRQRVVSGKSGAGRVDVGGRRIL